MHRKMGIRCVREGFARASLTVVVLGAGCIDTRTYRDGEVTISLGAESVVSVSPAGSDTSYLRWTQDLSAALRIEHATEASSTVCGSSVERVDFRIDFSDFGDGFSVLGDPVFDFTLAGGGLLSVETPFDSRAPVAVEERGSGSVEFLDVEAPVSSGCDAGFDSLEVAWDFGDNPTEVTYRRTSFAPGAIPEL